MKLYLCKRASGRWCAVAEKWATIPPFEVIDGPYEAPEARKEASLRNVRKAPPWKKHPLHEDCHL